MRIWVIGRKYPTPENNMIGSFELEQAQMLAKRGIEVIYPVLDIRSIKKWRKFGFLTSDAQGVTVEKLSVPVGGLLSKLTRGKIKQLLTKKLYSHLVNKYGTPDIIHIHYPSIFNPAPFAALQAQGVRLVVTEHYTKVQKKELSEKLLNNLTWFAKHADAFLCVGEPLKKSIEELTGTDRPIRVVPNVVSSLFTYRPEQRTENQDFRFVAAGRLVACKCFDLLINAFMDAFGGQEHMLLDIIGNGEEYDHLKKIIEERGAQKQVTLLGVMNREKVAAYFQKCDALVLSSNLETFGVPVIEAMASGLPVVTSDAIGFMSYINKNNGIAFPADDRVSLMEAMKTLYQDYQRYDLRSISEEAQNNFGEDSVFNMLYSIYTGS